MSVSSRTWFILCRVTLIRGHFAPGQKRTAPEWRLTAVMAGVTARQDITLKRRNETLTKLNWGKWGAIAAEWEGCKYIFCLDHCLIRNKMRYLF
jgi:hypothetical protein